MKDKLVSVRLTKRGDEVACSSFSITHNALLTNGKHAVADITQRKW